MEKQAQFDQSRQSSGFFSFEAHAGETSLTCELVNDGKKSDFACEKENFGETARWQTERHKQMYRMQQFAYRCYINEKEEFYKRINVLEKEVTDYKDKFQKMKNENNYLLEEIGRLEFEKEEKTNKQKRQNFFRQIYFPKRNKAEDDVVNDQTNTERAYSQLSVSTEQPINITTILESVPDEENATNNITHTKFGLDLKPDEPCTSECSASTNTQQPTDMTETLVLTTDEENTNDVTSISPPQNEPRRDNILDKNSNLSSGLLLCYDKDKYYQDMLKDMGKFLPHDDVLKLKEWASEKFSIDPELNAADILSLLDQNENINTLSELRSFFNSISRTDNVYRIDEFLQGNYIQWRIKSDSEAAEDR